LQLALPLIALALAAPSDEGRRIFHDPGIGKNGVSCAGCHGTVANEAKDGDGLIRAGHPLAGVAKRPFWRGDRKRRFHRDLGDAANVCVMVFQGGRPLEAERLRPLVAYLKSISRRGRARPLTIETALEADLDYDRPKYRGGDPLAGRDVFYRACHGCHPHARAGTGPAIAGQSVADIAKYVREGNGLLRGARKGSSWMPAFGLDRLSHQQVADVAAWVSKQPSP
jgi:mono/diheme cytochrome c family protein